MSEVDGAVRALLRRLRNARPLGGGSLLVTIFGDAIAPRGGAITLGALIRLAEPFGLSERLVRTSVARLAGEGWLESRRAGRRSEYCLSASGAQRFAEATARIYGGEPAAWDGMWTLLLLQAPAARDRRAAGDALRWLGFGEIAPGVFAHPALATDTLREVLGTLPAAPQALVLESRTGGADQDRALVRSGWDLRELGRQYAQFSRDFGPLAAALGAGAPGPEAAFIARTLLIHRYRRILLQDPLLPPRLLPPDWVGSSASTLCRGLYGRLYDASEVFVGAHGERLDGALPRPQRPPQRRFGRPPASGRP